MTSRRQFLWRLTGAMMFTRAVAPGVPWPEASADATLYKVIVDERFAASARFARHFSGRGIPVRSIRGDVTALWFHDLHFHWRSSRAPIAGLTTPESLFCLEVLARDAGMHVTGRRLLDSGLIAWSIGPRPSRLV